MKKSIIYLMSIAVIGLVSCSKDDDSDPVTQTITVDSSQPMGTFNVMRSGSFVEQNSTGSQGTAELGTDDNGTSFLRFGSDFMTELGTGTVSVYFSTSMDFNPDPMNGNPDLSVVGAVSDNGEMFFKLSGSVDPKWTHVILWCGSANIPFGYAELQ